jgi:DNA-binding protein HU-beta
MPDEAQTVTRRDLARASARAAGVTVPEAAEVVDQTLDEIVAALVAGESVTLRGFGAFEPVARAARPAHHFHAGERLMAPAHRAVLFRPSPALLAALAGHGRLLSFSFRTRLR